MPNPPASSDNELIMPVSPPDTDQLAGAVQPQRQTLLAAQDDYSAIQAWLAKTDVGSDRRTRQSRTRSARDASRGPAPRESSKTTESYRKEAGRFLTWLHRHGLSLRTFSIEAAAAYVRFLEDPQPANIWVGPKQHRDHPDWRPFTGPLSPASIRQARLILGSMYAFLVQGGYAAGNPFRMLKRMPAPARRIHERVLYVAERTAVLRSIESMPKNTDRERAHYHRCRWAFHLIVLTGLRRAEAANARMGDVWRREVDGEVVWTLTVKGKGDKVRDVPLPDQVIEELQVYRESRGLAPSLPLASDHSPLLAPVTHTRRHLSEKAVYLLVKQLFRDAARLARDEGNEDLAARLELASTHWLRHTGATLQIEAGTPLEMVQDNFGHASINTTREYVHVEPARRYKAARKLKM